MKLRDYAPRACLAPRFKALGIRVDAVQIPDVITRMEEWIRENSTCHYIAVTGMHGIVESRHDPEFRKILDAADLVVPDGKPIVWLGRFHGHDLSRRVYGPELMLKFFEVTGAKKYKHYFYGGARNIPEHLAEVFKERFPGALIAGVHSPPFRSMTPDEDIHLIDMINSIAPDVLWIGLSTPKQERWMYNHRDRLRVPVLVGVGAAFDIHSGTKKQAPEWMREHGFEWVFRLFQEPRRLWKRYLVYGSEFVVYATLELLGVKKFD